MYISFFTNNILYVFYIPFHNIMYFKSLDFDIKGIGNKLGLLLSYFVYFFRFSIVPTFRCEICLCVYLCVCISVCVCVAYGCTFIHFTWRAGQNKRASEREKDRGQGIESVWEREREDRDGDGYTCERDSEIQKQYVPPHTPCWRV